MFVVADDKNPAPFRGLGRKPWKPAKLRSIINLRLSSLERLIEGRHGGPVDTDDGETYYLAALPHLVAKAWAYGNDESRIRSLAWAAMWTPTLWAERSVSWFQEQEQRILREFDNHDGEPSLPSADELAKLLCITQEEVKAYRLHTIGAVDRLKAQRIAEEREADRQYQKAKRASKGATPREESASARQPWKALGMSRATYYRQLAARARETVSSDETNSSETGEAVLNDALSGMSSTVPSLPANDDVKEVPRQTVKRAA